MTWNAEEILPTLDFARDNGTEGLLHAQSVLDSLLQSVQAPVQLEAFSSSPYRYLAASICLLLTTLGLLLGSARPHLRWTVLQLASVGMAIVFTTGGFDVLLPRPTAHNILVEVAPRASEQNTVLLSAHYDSKTEPFDYVTRTILLLATLAAVPLALVAQHRIRRRRRRWMATLPAVLLVLSMSLQGSGRWSGVGRSHGIRDNAAACALLAELCSRALHRPLEHTRLQFAWWAGEEIGAQGSQAWAQHHVGELPDAVLNLELIGAGPDLAVGMHEWTARGLRSPDPELLQWFETHSNPSPRVVPVPILTDAGAFLAAGVPALTLLNLPATQRWPRGMHSAKDAMGALNQEGLSRTRDALLAVLLHLDTPARAAAPAGGDAQPHVERQTRAHRPPLLQSAP
jgi:hypothetical protein